MQAPATPGWQVRKSFHPTVTVPSRSRSDAFPYFAAQKRIESATRKNSSGTIRHLLDLRPGDGLAALRRVPLLSCAVGMATIVSGPRRNVGRRDQPRFLA